MTNRARSWWRDEIRPRLLVPILAALVAMAIPAVAITVFTPSNPGGDVNMPGLTPNWPAGTYTKGVIGSGGSYTFLNPQTKMLWFPAGTVSSVTVTMAPAPPDGQEACLFSTQTISAITLNANTGQTIFNAITAMTANVRYCYTYSLSNTTWGRSQ